MSDRRTYWHLEGKRKVPDEYEIVTSQLLYYRERGFEVNTPIDAWYAKYQRGSALVAPEWEAFRDPRATTYASYVAMQREREIFVDGLLGDQPAPDHPMLGPLRFPIHGLHMVAAYIGSMAPSGRLVVALAFQAGDELRRVQRLAYRFAQAGGDGAVARTTWTTDPHWQPLRELVERLLVTYDWGEALVALNVAIKPAFDALVSDWGDDGTRRMLGSLALDQAWHREWTRAALAIATDSRATIEPWLAKWRPRVDAAIAALAPLAADGALDRARAAAAAFVESL